MPWAAIIPAAIGGIASLISGGMGASAASGASAAQIAAAKAAQQQIMDLLNQYNPQIGTAAQTAATDVTGAAGQAQTGLAGTLAQNRSDVLGGVGQANQLLSPFLGMGQGLAGDMLGQLQTQMAPGGDLNRTFNFQDIQNLDPGYQFRMDQASKALQSSAAAKGGALGGGTLQALSSLNQNMASSEAQNAFSRLTQQQQDRFNRMNSLLGTGLNTGMGAATAMGQNVLGANQFLANQAQTGATTLGNWMIQPAQFAGGLLTNAAQSEAGNAMTAGQSIANLMSGAGNAQAAGIMGSANAWGQGLGGVASAAGNIANYYQLQTLLGQLKNPATTTI